MTLKSVICHVLTPHSIVKTFSILLFTAIATAAHAQIVFPHNGDISTIVGNGTVGYTGDGGLATHAEVDYPGQPAFDRAGNLYFVDNNVIREVSVSTGIITTVAGNNTQGYSGDGGPATSAQLRDPGGVAVDMAGNIYIADMGNQVIREVQFSSARGVRTITTVAGTGVAGYSGDGGLATSAQLSWPSDVKIDLFGNLYIADEGNDCIRKISASSGSISTVAGNGTYGYSGDGMLAISAEMEQPDSIAIDAGGNIYIVDNGNQRIRKVSASTGIINTLAGNGTRGYLGDGGAATSAELNWPSGVAVDTTGNVYIADKSNQRIRMVNISGTISTLAGNGIYGFSGDGGYSNIAELFNPGAVAVDNANHVYISDTYNDRVRVVTGTPPPTPPIGPTATVATPYEISATVTVSMAGGGGYTTSTTSQAPYVFLYEDASGTWYSCPGPSSCAVATTTNAPGSIPPTSTAANQYSITYDLTLTDATPGAMINCIILENGVVHGYSVTSGSHVVVTVAGGTTITGSMRATLGGVTSQTNYLSF